MNTTTAGYTKNMTVPTQYPFYAMSPVFEVESVGDVNERFDLSTLDADSPAGFVFRVCGAGGGDTDCDTAFGGSDAGWVPTLNPVVRVAEGGDPVSYQYRMHWPGSRPAGGLVCIGGTCWEVDGHIRVGFEKGAFSSVRNSYSQDRDRLNCFAKPDGSKGHEVSGIWGAYVKHQANRDYRDGGGTQKRPTNELWLDGTADGANVGTYPGRTDGARVVSDMWGGCPFVTNSYPTAEYDVWQTVMLGAGHDADAFSHDVTLTHKVNWGHLGRTAGLVSHRAPTVGVHIVDDDEWDQNIEVASYDAGTDATGTWRLLERQGLQKALPEVMDVGVVYKFKVRLTDRSVSSESHPYSLHPQSGGVSIWADEPYRSLADDPPYGVAWSWSPYGSLNHDDEVTVSVRADTEGPLVIRQRAPGLRSRTDTQLPRNLGSDPGNPVTALAGDATRSSDAYWFEESSTVSCVGCPATNDDDDGGGGDGLTPDPNGGDGGDGLTVVPSITITAGDAVAEGGTAGFTIAADPPPAAPITVNVGVTQAGSFGATGAAAIAVSGATTTYTVTTVDDEIDEPDGSVTATVQAGTGYTVGTASTATVNVTDDDAAAAVQPEDPLVKYAALVKSFYDRISDRHQHGDSASGGWNKRFLKAMGHPEYVDYPQAAVTAARATELYNHGGPGANTAWEGTAEAIQYRLDYDAGTLATTVNPLPPDPDPVITISGGSGITEGGTATFTVTATPVPASPITVNVGVSESGSFGATGAATLSVSGAVTTYTVTTSDDGVDEPDGSVTATVQSGTGYTVGTVSTATVNVADDDDPPPPDPVPVITISGGSAITEGDTATFTITASPAPATPITVNVGVSESGSFGATGAATIAVSGAAATYTVTTSDDNADEPDGSVTATVQTGTGYTVGAASTATVAVADDDDPPVVVGPKTGFVASIEQLRDDYSAYADWATGTWHQYMVHYSSGEILALLNSDTPAANSVSNQALFFRAIRAAKSASDTDAAALFGEIRDHYNIKKIG